MGLHQNDDVCTQFSLGILSQTKITQKYSRGQSLEEKKQVWNSNDRKVDFQFITQEIRLIVLLQPSLFFHQNVETAAYSAMSKNTVAFTLIPLVKYLEILSFFQFDVLTQSLFFSVFMSLLSQFPIPIGHDGVWPQIESSSLKFVIYFLRYTQKCHSEEC